jgi:hypothetical protein
LIAINERKAAAWRLASIGIVASAVWSRRSFHQRAHHLSTRGRAGNSRYHAPCMFSEGGNSVSANIFTYGSLMFAEVWQPLVVGRYRSEPAILPGTAKRR